jgi:predicted esterase
MTREDRELEIADQLAYLARLQAELLPADAPVSVGVLGFSQGTATAGRWIVQGGARPERLILWGGALPPDVDDGAARAALAGTRVDLVAGERDEVLPPELFERELARLRGLGLDVRGHRFSGGHRLDRSLLTELLSRAT